MSAVEHAKNPSSALAVGTLAALVVALPAAIRASGAGASLPLSWLALAGATAIMAGLVGACLRSLSPWPQSLTALIYGVVFALPVLGVFATVLKTATNHRPLGGVTFAVIGAGVLIGCLVFAARAVAWTITRPRRLTLQVIVALAGLLAARVLLSIPSEPALRGSLIDALALLVAIGIAGLWTPPNALRSRTVALGAFFAVAALGLGLTLLSPGTAEIARSTAPLLHGPWWLFSR